MIFICLGHLVFYAETELLFIFLAVVLHLQTRDELKTPDDVKLIAGASQIKDQASCLGTKSLVQMIMP